MAVSKNNAKQANDSMRLQDLFAICISKWKWFVISILCTMGIAVLYILRTPPVYTRSASLLIKEDAKGHSSFSSELNAFADMGLFNSNTNVNNELTSIQSPAVISEVVRRLNLDVNYTEDGTFYKKNIYGSSLPVNVSINGIGDNDFYTFGIRIEANGQVKISGLTLNGEDKCDGRVYKGVLNDSISTPVGPITIRETPYYEKGNEYDINISRSGLVATIDACHARLSVSLDNEKNTIINLSYQDVSIQRAEDFLNTLVSVYNENWVKDKNQIAVSTSQFINDRLNVIEQELGNVDNDISSYKSEHMIPDVEAASSMYMEQANATNAQILALNNELSMARYIRNFVSGDSSKNQLLPANSGINNATIERQISEYNDKLLQRNKLVATSSASNPLVMDMDKALASMRSSIIASFDNQISSLNTQIRSFHAREQQNNARIASNPTQSKYLLSVERQQKVKESLYLFLLQKREENELSQAFTAYNTRMITPPSGKLTPTAPIKRNILLAAFLAGLCFPVIIIVIRENTNTKVRGRKDIEKLTIPFIGEIPLHKNKSHKKQGKTKEYQVVVKEKSRNIINEAFRVVRTNLEFMLEEESENKVIMVSSVNPGSGKTFVAINLAASFAIQERKTVVIDLDMRKASLSHYASDHRVGVSAYLSNHVSDWTGLVVKDSERPNLDIIPVGAIPPNPAELLLKPRLAQLIQELRASYDIVIIDCPPVEIVADATIIAKLVDMTVFIIRAGLLERDMLPVVECYYSDQKFRNMSLLLNGTEAYEGRYGYHRYGYHYGYGYGYGGYTKEE